MSQKPDFTEEEPRITLSIYAWVMASISAVFVFLGVQIIFGGLAMLSWKWRYELPLRGWVLAPVSLICGTVMGWMSARQSLDLARKKRLLEIANAPPQFECRGCGEKYFTHEPHCPLCGRKPEGTVSKDVMV
jgi:hypothetical protein